MRALWGLGLISLSAVVSADIIHLDSGKSIQGVVVQETASQLQVETSAGIMRFQRGEVSRIDRDNAQVVATLQKLVASGEGTEAVDRISRLDRTRFSAAELATVDQLAAQVNQQSALSAAQTVHQQDMKVVGEAAAVFQKLGWRESAAHLEHACAAAQVPLINSQVALVELYAANATYPEAMDFSTKLDGYMAGGSTAVYQQALASARQKFDQRIDQLRIDKEKRDQAFTSAGEARARLDQAAQQRAQAAAVQGARIAAANPNKFKPKAADLGKIEAAKKSRAAALTREAMDKAGVKMNCQGGVCPSR